ncbi:hypothetical protein AMS68_000026 [Peltaster fructicola]|uniref:DUF1760-domain-containing protein n=1 Tax=Peltaster fructicola TaxID=286661 RepID=A0A6H0XIP6_9PEZI|nr:hypothetical protein AMS68_000026 [Peltaster fructicola]
MAQESPLITALPPHTDYISYLTIVEQYLTEETLPILHKVLQDETLTTNIGWDLVQILTPMLPASVDCLNDIARLGNPREVILKVTEALRFIEYDNITHHVDHEELSVSKLKITTTQPPLPLFVQQYNALLSMLTTLHARIRTKYPSRFLSTTLQAVLSSFASAESHRDDMVPSIVQMIKQMRGIQRPALPSRNSSNTLSRTVTKETNAPAASDPEGTSSSQSEPGEAAIQTKLFQAFLTHVIEEYVSNMPTVDGVPGMAWSTRLMETLHPERVIPNTKTTSYRFKADGVLHTRNDVLGQLVSLAHDLDISDSVILKAATTADIAAIGGDEEEPPASSADIPLSSAGSALLYTARQMSTILHGRQQQLSEFAIFPQHHDLMNVGLSAASSAMGTVGTEPEALIDACLALGLLALENDNIGAPGQDIHFTEYLQMTSLLASNCPNANLRGHAHYLVSTVLRSHPDDKVRFAFISDTLEHCPFENLKTTAVGWIKGEVVEASVAPHEGQESSVFSKPFALERLAPYLFPALQADLVTAPVDAAWRTFQLNLSFYHAVLNFLVLLVSSKQLRQHLDIQDLWKDHDIGGSYLQPLRNATQRFMKSIETEDGAIEYSTEEDKQQLIAGMNVMTQTLERVTEAAKTLNEP